LAEGILLRLYTKIAINAKRGETEYFKFLRKLYVVLLAVADFIPYMYYEI